MASSSGSRNELKDTAKGAWNARGTIPPSFLEEAFLLTGLQEEWH